MSAVIVGVTFRDIVIDFLPFSGPSLNFCIAAALVHASSKTNVASAEMVVQSCSSLVRLMYSSSATSAASYRPPALPGRLPGSRMLRTLPGFPGPAPAPEKRKKRREGRRKEEKKEENKENGRETDRERERGFEGFGFWA